MGLFNYWIVGCGFGIVCILKYLCWVLEWIGILFKFFVCGYFGSKIVNVYGECDFVCKIGLWDQVVVCLVKVEVQIVVLEMKEEYYYGFWVVMVGENGSCYYY